MSTPATAVRSTSGDAPAWVPALLSFVVPAHDEAPLIGATLASLHTAADANAVPFESIVVDDASTDATATIASAAGARVVRVAHRQIAATRNAGARMARGDVLVFVDADTLVDAGLLRAALDALRDGAIGGGAAVAFTGRVGWHQRLLTRLVMRAFRRTGIAPGCFIFCTRAGFDAAGGFDERWFAGEDVAISRALARAGRFVILCEAARTSPRKLHTHGWVDHLRLVLRFALRGRRLLHSREPLALWYGTRRHDPRDPNGH